MSLTSWRHLDVFTHIFLRLEYSQCQWETLNETWVMFLVKVYLWFSHSHHSKRLDWHTLGFKAVKAFCLQLFHFLSTSSFPLDMNILNISTSASPSCLIYRNIWRLQTFVFHKVSFRNLRCSSNADGSTLCVFISSSPQCFLEMTRFKCSVSLARPSVM